MPTQPALIDVLRDGGHGVGNGEHGVIVAVDFGGPREEAGFSDLLPHMSIEHSVLAPQTTVDLDGDPESMRRRQLEFWLEAIRSRGRQISAVMGYCAGSAMATRLAVELADGTGRPALVLLDPSWPTREVLLEAHDVAVQRLLDPIRDPAARESLRVAVPERTDPTRLARALVEHYADTAWRVAAQVGLSQAPVRSLIARIERHLSYLLIAATEAAEVTARHTLPAPGSVLTILSEATPDECACIPGATVRTELPRPRLLADPAVAGRVADFLHHHEVAPQQS